MVVISTAFQNVLFQMSFEAWKTLDQDLGPGMEVEIWCYRSGPSFKLR
jgi:hypothetical protein